ncbi:hypothetical protein [Kutzneria albida]|uniref:Uncharacterized protein n=1 Tax=Kutzneria albida DSM 43870 TaxID=1449976 RepID=W5W7T7_9PSEU|nr:hypothetical protein [Kutzneria albida]AHH94279.1 hypothetical protein KALB_905 [Kutzneria albida DSM 43870]
MSVQVRSTTQHVDLVVSAVHRVLRDYAPEAVHVVIGDLEPKHSSFTLTASFEGGMTIGHAVLATEDAEDVCVAVADQLQDMAIENRFGAWPRCPGHTHPLWPSRTGDVASWVCPTEPAHCTRPIGRLLTR